jgi:hypothetical protein
MVDKKDLIINLKSYQLEEGYNRQQNDPSLVTETIS